MSERITTESTIQRPPNLFLDSSALVAGAISAQGAARAILTLAELGIVRLTVSQQVTSESERALARKAPSALPLFREIVRYSSLRIVQDPSTEDIGAHHGIIGHLADVPIVVAAMQTQVDFLVTLNRRHFIDDPGVAQRSGLRIGTPGDALGWLRQNYLLRTVEPL